MLSDAEQSLLAQGVYAHILEATLSACLRSKRFQGKGMQRHRHRHRH